MGKWKSYRKGPVVTCEKCGKKFKSWRADRLSRFCSRECAPAGRQPTKPSTECEHCGTIFRRYGGGHAARFCSRQCYLDSGTKRKDIHGYVLVWAPDEPGAYKSGQIKEHRLVMQRHLGRPLERHETVHHINGDKADNRIENLQLRQGRHGKGHAFRCMDCGSHNVESVPLD